MANRFFANRATEKDIRDWLNTRGYAGQSADFSELELHAIQRPGWKQLFRFSVEAADESGQRQKLYGCVMDDERKRTEVYAFENVNRQRFELNRLAQDMLPAGSRRGSGNSEGEGLGPSPPASLLSLVTFALCVIAGVILLAFCGHLLGMG